MAQVAITHARQKLQQGITEWIETSGSREDKLMKAAVKAMRVVVEGYGREHPTFFTEVREFEEEFGISSNKSEKCDSRYGSRETTPSPEQTDAITQTTPVQTSEATTNTPATPVTPVRTYADAVVQGILVTEKAAPAQALPTRKGMEKATCQNTSTAPLPERRPPQAPVHAAPATPTRAVVLHGVPTKYKPGQMRRWIQEDNPTGAPKIIGIRWLLQDYRRVGKLASSLVI